MTKNRIEARLLYSRQGDFLAHVDQVALRATIERLGLRVVGCNLRPGAFLLLELEKTQLLIAYASAPISMTMFRGATRPSEDDAKRRDVLRRLAGHKASLSVVALDNGREDTVPAHTKKRLVWEIVDHILAVTEVDIVQCPGLDRLMTADEAEDWLAHAADRLPDPQAQGRDARRDIFKREPALSPEVMTWLDEQKQVEPEEDLLGEALRGFLDHKPEARRLRDTAAGRSALYVLSATIMIFALPLGASALTYNALSGGSLRVTAHTMVAAGLVTVGEKLGLMETAQHLIGFFN